MAGRLCAWVWLRIGLAHDQEELGSKAWVTIVLIPTSARRRAYYCVDSFENKFCSSPFLIIWIMVFCLTQGMLSLWAAGHGGSAVYFGQAWHRSASDVLRHDLP